MARMEITIHKVKGIPVGGEREWSADDGLVIVRRPQKHLWEVNTGSGVLDHYATAEATAAAIWEALGW